MNKKISHPYAKLFEMVMGIIPEARKLLQHFADEQLVSTLDLQTLKTAHGTFKGGKTGLSNLITDMLYTCKCKGKDAYVHLLLEHKSWLENPKLQIMLYLLTAYNQQILDWKQARKEAKVAAKKRGEVLPYQEFKPTPIISILFYHGSGKWKDYKFADQFDLPETWMVDFIPQVKIFVIDMDEHPDSKIENIGASFLQPMLYIFKHMGDKNFLLQNIKKVFKFVTGLGNDKPTQRFFKTIIYVMIQAFKLKKEEVDEIVEQIPFDNKNYINMVQETAMSVIDEAIRDGILIGEEKGEVRGEAKGKKLTKIETILIFLKNFKTYKNLEIALLCKVEEKFVADIRKTFEQDKEIVVKRFARTAFNTVPNMKEKDFLEMEEKLLAFWREFKGIDKTS